MNDPEHDWAWNALTLHAAEQLSLEESARLEAHLQECAACDEEIGRLRNPEPVPEGEPTPKRKLRERMAQSIRTLSGSAARSPASRGLIGAAAVIFLAVVGLIFAEVEGGGAEKILGTSEDTAILIPPVESMSLMGRQRPVSADTAIPTDAPLIFFPEARESDHNESADNEDYRQMKGGSQGYGSGARGESNAFLSYIRGEGGGYRGRGVARASGVYDTIGVGSGGGTRYANVFGGKERVAQSEVSAPGFFKPGEALAAARPQAYPNSPAQTGKVYVPGKAELDPPPPAAQPQDEAPRMSRKIIRSGDMEFEIDAFDAAVGTVTKIAIEEQGYIATVNSEKLQNGKVRGTVVVRIPPDNLDRLLLKLRALGELKSQRIGSADVTKNYFDLESRLRAARTMEERLIAIIKDGKGAIKDLLLAEKELGEWRTRVESMVGEINYYNNLIAHSTLTITLTEKEIRAPFAVLETERVELAVEVEDVEKAHRDALAAIGEAKGRVIKSELKQFAAGQYNAIVQFEVAPEQAGTLRDRLKQLGIVARLDINRAQETQGGSGKVQDAKVQRNDTQILLSLYNLANLSPRETVHLNLACIDAEKAYKTVLERVEKASGRVLSSNLNRPKSDQTAGKLSFQVNRAEAEAVLQDIREVGEVIKLDVTEDPDSANATRSKRGFYVNLFALGLVQPRETSTVVLATKDVPASYRGMLEAMKAAGVRILSAQLNENDQRNVTADLSVEARRGQEEALAAAMAKAGDVYTRTSTRAQDSENVVDSKIALNLRFFNAASIPPRETVKIGIEVGDADVAVKALEADFKTRVVDTRHSQKGGERESVLTIELPYQELSGALDRIKGLGSVRDQSSAKNAGVPANALALARIEVRVGHEVLLGQDSGPMANIRRGLSISLQAASWALMLIMIGVCFVLPILLLFWTLAKIHRKLRPKTVTAA
jgi:hypothetical protein